MGTPARYYSSTAVRTTLSSSIGTLDTSINIASDSGFPPSYPFILVLEKDSANEEIVEVTGKVGTAFTVDRGIDGTTARSHSAGVSVEHALIADDLTDFRAHQAAGADVHDIGASASVVGTTSTQTLTNKTLTSPTIAGATVSGTVTGGTLSGQTITSGTLGSALAAGGFKVTGLADPSSAQDAATKNWAETSMTSQLSQATTQATNAASSASAAAGSAAAAATAETNAETAETNAETAQAAAEAAQAAAEAAQSAAETAETNAETAEAAASASASAASSSASSASGSASAASGSASAAAASASSASNDATAAASSAASAASALDSFDDRYLGSKASAPLLDNDGNALVTGALFYLNTGTSEQIGMYVYDGGSWLKASAASVASIVTYEFTATSGQTVFTGNDDNAVSLSFTAGLIQVFLNGVLLSPGDDYTTSTNTVTLASGAAASDVLVVVAFASFNVANTYTQAQVDALLAAKSPLASPTFTGIPTAPTAAAGTNTTQLATTAFVQSAGGLVLVASQSFSAVSSVSVNNCFSATYQNYKIVLNATLASFGADGFLRLRASGSDNSTANSYTRQRITASAGVVAGTRDTDNTWGVWQLNSTAQNGIILEMFNPFASTTTTIQTTVASSDSSAYLANYVGIHNQSTSYDGFTIYNTVANMSGTIRVYGYKD